MKNLYLVVITLLIHSHGYAQWECMNGPFGSYINDIGKNDKHIFSAATAGLYRSADQGLTWEHKPFVPGKRYPCLQFDVSDSLLIADAVEILPDTLIRHMYKSIDDGESWLEIPRPHRLTWFEIAIIDSTIFAYDQLNIWVTHNDGQQWKQSLINHEVQFPDCFHRYGSKLYVGAIDHVYIYEGDDSDWSEITIPNSENVGYIYTVDSLILVHDYNRYNLYISEDGGINWFNSPGTQWDWGPNYFVRIADTLYATGYEAIYTSVDNGHTWSTWEAKGLDYVNSLIAVDTLLLAGYQWAGMFRSMDFGRHFQYSSEGIDAAYVEKLFVHGDEILTGGRLQGVFNYDAKDNQWKRTYFDEYQRNNCEDIDVHDGQPVMLAFRQALWFDSLTGQWTENTPEEQGIYVYTDLFQTSQGMMIGGNRYSAPGNLYLFTEHNNWKRVLIEIEGEYADAYFFAENNVYQFIAEQRLVGRSLNGEEDWHWLPEFHDDDDMFIVDLVTLDEKLFVITSNSIGTITKLYVSYNNGQSWERGDTGIPTGEHYTGVLNLISVGDYLLCCTLEAKSGIYYSRKDHVEWHLFNEELPVTEAKDIAFDGEYLYAAMDGSGVWKRNVLELFETSIKENNIPVALSLFPNPADESVSISIQGAENISGELLLFDVHGRMVMEMLITHKDISVDLKNLPGGVYFAEVRTGGGSFSSKLMVQH